MMMYTSGTATAPPVVLSLCCPYCGKVGIEVVVVASDL